MEIATAGETCVNRWSKKWVDRKKSLGGAKTGLGKENCRIHHLYEEITSQNSILSPETDVLASGFVRLSDISYYRKWLCRFASAYAYVLPYII